MKTLAVLFACCCMASTASAALLVYEPFDYDSGDAIIGKTNASTGNNWAAAGLATSPVHQATDLGGAGSLTGPSGFPASVGNAGVMMNADNTQFARLALPQTYYTNTSLYYSVLLNIPDLTGLTVPNSNANANNDGIIMFNNATGAGARPTNWAGELVIRLGSTLGTYNLAVRASAGALGTPGGATQWTGDIAADSTTHLVVVRYVQGADASISTDDSNDIWVDPSAFSFGAPEGSEPAPDKSTIGSINAGSPLVNYAASLMIGAGISAGATPNQVYIDEIRVGTTWADVTSLPIPEPGSLALLLIGCVLMISRRRMR